MKIAPATLPARLGQGLKTFAADVGEGFFVLTHSGLALLGVAVVLGAGAIATQPELRSQTEARLSNWLTERQAAALGLRPEPQAIERATAAHPHELPREQANLTAWISKKYRVAPEPVAALVAEAYEIGPTQQLDPTLLLAVMAIESSFNPFAQSPVGAQGLMQVMTNIHSDKYQHFGGHFAAFDPKTNLRVGARVLQEYVRRSGSIENGLKWYVGAAKLPSDGGYASKVLAEHARLKRVARGQNVSVHDSTPWISQKDAAAATTSPATAAQTQASRSPAPKPAPADKGVNMAAL